MHSDDITPQVIELKYYQIELMVTDDGKSETLIGIADGQAFVSHNMGVSWKKIENISGFTLNIQPRFNEMHIIDQSGYRSGHGYFLDAEGNVFKEISGPSDICIDSLDSFSRHPHNPNAILACCTASTWSAGFDSDQRKWYYYTKDGGTEWKEMESNEDADSDYGGPDYEFVDDGVPDLIYKYEGYDHFGYSLNLFSDSNLEKKFKKLPFKAFKVRDKSYFFGRNDQKEFYVSRDGVKFERIKLPPPYENSTIFRVHGGLIYSGQRIYHSTNARFGDSIFLQGLCNRNETKAPEFDADSRLPWTTLFHYDLKYNRIKFLLGYCYDLAVISAEKGIIIANAVENPQECIEHDEVPIIKTMITFNDGIDWQSVKGPNGIELSIANFTKFNFHGEMTNDEKPSVPGMLIVYGKEGPIEHYMGKLRDRSKFYSSLSTYMTKDSGRSWCKIHDNAMEWTIGGSGEIIVLNSKQPNSHNVYSLDGGVKWHELKLDLPEFKFYLPPVSCESNRFLLRDSRYLFDSRCKYYCLSFDPVDQKK